jgi:hypothetical protein
MRCTPSDRVWELISSGNLVGAVKVVRGVEYPYLEMVDQLQRILQTETPSLNFLSPDELRLVRLAAAGAWIFGVNERYERFYPEDFAWTHPLSPGAAAANLILAYQAQRDIRFQPTRDVRLLPAREISPQPLKDGRSKRMRVIPFQQPRA